MTTEFTQTALKCQGEIFASRLNYGNMPTAGCGGEVGAQASKSPCRRTANWLFSFIAHKVD
jgi:hypothetical protein